MPPKSPKVTLVVGVRGINRSELEKFNAMFRKGYSVAQFVVTRARLWNITAMKVFNAVINMLVHVK